MNYTPKPIEQKPLKRCTVDELLRALASDAVMPGCGTASGIALALAAACAGKAIAITQRHDSHPDAMAGLQEQVADLQDRALALAEADALQFKQALASESPTAIDELVQTDCTMVQLCSRLDSLLDENEQKISENVSGDWHAARALSQAARLIQQENVRELKDGL